MTLEEIANAFQDIFEPHPEVYGVSKLTGAVRSKDGKQETRSYLVRKPLTREIWVGHLEGKQSIGVVPIQPTNTVKWGAIDIDLYQCNETIEALQKKIKEHKLPFVTCRSKSGGAHLYLFIKERVPAVQMIDKLTSFSAFFGQGVSEIFPKQPRIGKRKDDSEFGNWLNMPYDGPESLRVATTVDAGMLDQEQFISFVHAKQLTVEQFTKLEPPKIKEEPLPDGPPCLNYIFTERLKNSEMRNITLANTAVYLKKAHPDDWHLKVHAYNKLFPEPLPEREVENIIKSYQKKDYQYQCSKEPLCRYCDAKVCAKRQYGVGGGSFEPNNRTLTLVKTNPPLWFLTIQGQEIQLTTQEFDQFHLFNRRVMETILQKYPPMKQEDWTEIQNRLMKNCTVIEIPKEMSPVGYLVGLLSEFANMAQDEPEAIFRGQPWKNKLGDLVFRMRDFRDYLKRERFDDLPLNEITSALKRVLEGESTEIRHENKSARCWKIPAAKLQDATHPPIETIEEQDPF